MGWSKGGVWLPQSGWTPPLAVGPTSLLLDSLSVGAVAAYSTRKLRTAYAGPSLQVIRDSDSTTLDIGFVGGQLDTTSLLAFCSTTGVHAYINIWYDQSGNGNNALPGTGPAIAAGGAMYANLNGHAALPFGETSPSDILTTTLSLSEPLTYVLASQLRAAPASGSSATLISGGDGSTRELEIGVYNGPPYNWYLYDGTNFPLSGTPDLNAHEVLAIFNGASSSLNIDNASVWSGTLATGVTAPALYIGAFWLGYAGSPSNTNIGEVIVFNSALSGGDQTLIHTNYQTQWGTP